jgi:hypothetical protein
VEADTSVRGGRECGAVEDDLVLDRLEVPCDGLLLRDHAVSVSFEQRETFGVGAGLTTLQELRDEPDPDAPGLGRTRRSG